MEFTCNMPFNQNGNLQIHCRTHSVFKPYSCDVCEKMFNQTGGLEVHHTSISERSRNNVPLVKSHLIKMVV